MKVRRRGAYSETVANPLPPTVNSWDKPITDGKGRLWGHWDGYDVPIHPDQYAGGQGEGLSYPDPLHRGSLAKFITNYQPYRQSTWCHIDYKGSGYYHRPPEPLPDIALPLGGTIRLDRLEEGPSSPDCVWAPGTTESKEILPDHERILPDPYGKVTVDLSQDDDPWESFAEYASGSSLSSSQMPGPYTYDRYGTPIVTSFHVDKKREKIKELMQERKWWIVPEDKYIKGGTLKTAPVWQHGPFKNSNRLKMFFAVAESNWNAWTNVPARQTLESPPMTFLNMIRGYFQMVGWNGDMRRYLEGGWFQEVMEKASWPQWGLAWSEAEVEWRCRTHHDCPYEEGQERKQGYVGLDVEVLFPGTLPQGSLTALNSSSLENSHGKIFGVLRDGMLVYYVTSKPKRKPINMDKVNDFAIKASDDVLAGTGEEEFRSNDELARRMHELMTKKMSDSISTAPAGVSVSGVLLEPEDSDSNSIWNKTAALRKSLELHQKSALAPSRSLQARDLQTVLALPDHHLQIRSQQGKKPIFLGIVISLLVIVLAFGSFKLYRWHRDRRRRKSWITEVELSVFDPIPSE